MSVFQSILVKQDVRLAMHVGNCIVWNMESNLMVKCQVTELSEVEMILSTPSLVKLVLENMYHELFLLTWNPLSSVSIFNTFNIN